MSDAKLNHCVQPTRHDGAAKFDGMPRSAIEVGLADVMALQWRESVQVIRQVGV
jgi:hypothetical protein